MAMADRGAMGRRTVLFDDTSSSPPRGFSGEFSRIGTKVFPFPWNPEKENQGRMGRALPITGILAQTDTKNHKSGHADTVQPKRLVFILIHKLLIKKQQN